MNAHTTPSILSALKEHILILDGAMGTQLQHLGLEGNSEAFNLSQPKTIIAIHEAYINAGADIITANTFGGNYETAFAGTRLAREVANRHTHRPIWVAGTVGPSSVSLSMSTDASRPEMRACDFDELKQQYAQQIRGVVEGGADFLLLETCFDALNTKAALQALNDLGTKIPIMVSATCNDVGGHLLTGQTIEAFYTSIAHCKPFCVGLNCSMGAPELAPIVHRLAQFVPCAVSCHPNAGLPDALGNYNHSPEMMATEMRKMAIQGDVNILGGCCGTSPTHIQAIAQAVKDIAPRKIPETNGRENLVVAGLEHLVCDHFCLVGERNNVAGSRKFARLIANQQYDEALHIGIEQVEHGAEIIDINMDDALLNSKQEMRTFVRYIMSSPQVSRAALMIDSSDFETILEGLKNAQGKCIVNSISLKEGETAFLHKAKAINSLGASVVVMAFDEEGQATTYERKIAICERAYRLLTNAGIAPQNIIFDVNVLAVATGTGTDRKYAKDFIEAVRWIKENLSGAKTSGGISNLSFAFRGNNPLRAAMHSVFLHHAIAAGLDMAIINPCAQLAYEQIPPVLREAIEDVLLDRCNDATEKLVALALQPISAVNSSNCASSLSTHSLTLQELLIQGKTDGLQEKVMEQLEQLHSPQAVVEGPLMQGMEEVGKRFGKGRLFLPQVVQSARVMKQAVAILTPFMTQQKESARGSINNRPKAIFATVKGDVHDIGKNITASVLTCNGFQVIDLGVMVDNETILQAAKTEQANLILVSGLITPSLQHMEDLCRLMNERHYNLPLFVGGATTSALHTAVKLAPLYNHVFHGTDASSTAVLCKRCMSDRKAFETEEHRKQNQIRAQYNIRTSPQSKRQTFEDSDFLTFSILGEQNIPVQQLKIEDVQEFIDWHMFLSMWGIKAPDWEKPEVKSLLGQAKSSLLQQTCTIRIALQFVPFNQLHITFPADHFLRPDSPVGLFAVSVTDTNHDEACPCPACQDTMSKVLRLCLADATAEWIEHQINVPEGFRCIRPAIGYPSCPDHSLKPLILNNIPQSKQLGIYFTESFAMIPAASVCGFVILHTKAHYL